MASDSPLTSRGAKPSRESPGIAKVEREVPVINDDPEQQQDDDAHDGPAIIDTYSAEQQWDILKAAVPGYVDPIEKRKMEQRAQNIEQGPVSRLRPEDAAPQRCHVCGWIGKPRRWQKCDECGAADALSSMATAENSSSSSHTSVDEEPYECMVCNGDWFRDFSGGTPDTRHPTESLERILAEEHEQEKMVATVEEADDGMLGATTEKVVVKVAMDSGSVANVIGPDELPCDVKVEENNNDSHFVGANNSRIEKFGTCVTHMQGAHGAVGCKWQVANVTRPLHSVSTITGPYDGPGKQDVLFNNRRCVVVPPGVVDRILKEVNAVAEYERQGNLYLAEMTLSSFARQGPRAWSAGLRPHADL